MHGSVDGRWYVPHFANVSIVYVTSVLGSLATKLQVYDASHVEVLKVPS